MHGVHDNPTTDRDGPPASLANRHEIGAYRVSGRWLIAGVDMRGFATSDARAAKSDVALVLEPAPEFTGDVGGAFAHLPDRPPSRVVARIPRIGSAKLTEPGLAVDEQGLVERGALVEFQQSVSNAGGTTRQRRRDGLRWRRA